MTTASPRAWSRPAVIAVWWPKLRDRRTTRTRGSLAARSSTIFAVPSLDPSSTRTSSSGRPSSAAKTRSQNAAAVASSLYIGATTLSSFSSRDMLSI